MKTPRSLVLLGLLAAAQVQAAPVYFILSGTVTSGDSLRVGATISFRFSLDYPGPYGDADPSSQVGSYWMWSGPRSYERNPCLMEGGCYGTVTISDNLVSGAGVYDRIGIDYTNSFMTETPGYSESRHNITANLSLPAVLGLITTDALLDQFSWVSDGTGFGSMTYTLDEWVDAWGGSPGYSRTYINQLQLTSLQFGPEPVANVPLPGAIVGFSGALGLLAMLRRRFRVENM